MSTETLQEPQTLNFQAEVRQLLHLMIHSLYSNREIFLRELISNASDACDKLRFESLNHPELLEADGDLKITVDFDEADKTLRVMDNGIGMSREEAILNLGTIAKSGTREFFSRLTGDQQKDANLIGQFGVGFYSAFVVADRVTVKTRRAGLPAEEGVCWSCSLSDDTASEGQGAYTVSPLRKESRGTEIILHLREGQEDLLNGFRLKSLVRKYSDHIVQPIQMPEESFDEASGAPQKTQEFETVNQATALWVRSKNDLSEDDYHAFYKHVAHDFQAPLAYTHSKVEGRHEYTQLLYIPAHAPFDLWDRSVRHGVKLYVKRVFIMDDAEKLMPTYLRFVRGVVDSASLPLNVSREILQESRDIDALRAGCTKKVLSLLDDLAQNQPEKYSLFWGEFGQVLKEGVGEDFANKDKIAGLLRFASTHTDQPTQTVSLEDYLSRKKDGQEAIYFVTADSFNAAKNSPHLEIFRKKGIEVLLLSDRVDEWVVGHLDRFKEVPLRSVAKGGLDLGALQDENEKIAAEKEADECLPLVQRIQTALGERVKSVRITHRLTDSPACLVADEHDIGMNLARLMKASGQHAPIQKPILEINPHHPMVTKLKTETLRFDDWSVVLFEQALLAEGGTLDDPATFVKRINQLMLEMGEGA